MQEFSKILVTVDVTKPSFGAPDGPGQQVEALAQVVSGLYKQQQRPAQVTVITVVPDGQLHAEAVAEAARKSLTDRFVSLLDAGDVQVLVKAGVPFLEVIREVLRGGYDLAVVSARRSGEPGGEIVSNMATQLIRKCPCPVWVAPRDPTPKGQGSILSAVALDHGPASRVLSLSASIAALSERKWNALHVPEYPLEGGMRLRNVDAAEVQSYEADCREQAWAELHTLTDGLAADAGVEVKLWMAEGRPSEQIVKAEAKLDATLIVLGTIGRGGLAGVVIGSTAERTIAQACSSVLAIKPDDFVCPVTLS